MISEHFTREEFACRCGCGLDTVDAELITVLEDLRAWARVRNPTAVVLVNCGVRCPSHNKQVGGVPGSQHLVAKAADIRVRSLTPDEVASHLNEVYPDTHGIGRYHTFTHIDVRRNKARWSK